MAVATFAFEQPCPPASSLLHFPPLIDETSLYDLANVVRDRNYHAYRNDVTRAQLDQIILANGLITRLASLLFYTHTLLVRHVVETGLATDSTNNFSALNQASQELQRSILDKCNAPGESGIRTNSPSKNEERKSFFDELSPTASTTLVKFLSTLRADPNFIASHLIQAKEQDLESLTAWKPHHYNAKTKPAAHHGPNASSPSIEHIASFSRHDPLYALTYILFSPNPLSESSEFRFRLDTWSSVLAFLIDENRGGDVLSAVMDILSGSEWAIDSAFEILILDFLQSAARLNKSVLGDDERDEEVVESHSEFTDLCDQTLVDILNLVCSDGGIPSSAVILANAISSKCSNKEQAKAYIGTHWFKQHFFSKRIITPEVCPSKILN
jgi:hypothetical protein